MRKLITLLSAIAAGSAVSGCAQSYYALERLNHDLCTQRATPDCLDNGYVRAGATILADPYFGRPPRQPSDLGEPAAL
jgi:hypothetical protein